MGLASPLDSLIPLLTVALVAASSNGSVVSEVGLCCCDLGIGLNIKKLYAEDIFPPVTDLSLQALVSCRSSEYIN